MDQLVDDLNGSCIQRADPGSPSSAASPNSSLTASKRIVRRKAKPMESSGISSGSSPSTSNPTSVAASGRDPAPNSSRSEWRLLVHFIMTGSSDERDRIVASASDPQVISSLLEGLFTALRGARFSGDDATAAITSRSGEEIMNELNSAAPEDLPDEHVERIASLCEVLPGSRPDAERFHATMQRQFLNAMIDITTEAANRRNLVRVLALLFQRQKSDTFRKDPYECVTSALEKAGGARTNEIGVHVVDFLAKTQRRPEQKSVEDRLFSTFSRLKTPDVPKSAPVPTCTPATTGSGSTAPPPPSYAATSLRQMKGDTSVLTSESVSFGVSHTAPSDNAASTVSAGNASTTSSTPALVSINDLKWYERARKRTVYLTRLDWKLSDSEFRTIISLSTRETEPRELAEDDLTSSDPEENPTPTKVKRSGVFKMRLMGGSEVEGKKRSKFGFVEFARRRDANLCVRRLNGTLPAVGPGQSRIKAEIARRVIDSSDPRDALFDSVKGCIRACTFGLSVPLRSADPPAPKEKRPQSPVPKGAAQRSHCSLILHRQQHGEPTGGAAQGPLSMAHSCQGPWISTKTHSSPIARQRHLAQSADVDGWRVTAGEQKSLQ